MTVLSGTFWGADVYRTVVFPLNGDGSPKTNGLLPYEGLLFEGSRSFTPNFGDSLRIANVGDTRVRDTLILPTREPAVADLIVGYTVQAIDAAISGVDVIRTLGESPFVQLGTDKQGQEPDVALFTQQLGHDDEKLTRWHYYMVPKARVNLKPGAFNENAWEKTYAVVMSPSPKHFWGQLMTLVNDGCTEAVAAEGVSEGLLNFTTWEADGVEDVFPFNVEHPALSVDKIRLFNWTTGVEITAGITKTVTDITFAAPPADGTILVAKSEF